MQTEPRINYTITLTAEEIRVIGLALARKLPETGELADAADSINLRLLDEREKAHVSALRVVENAKKYVKGKKT